MSEIRSQATPARDELAETMVDDLFEAENCGELMTWDDNGTPWVNREAIAETLVPKGWSKRRTANAPSEFEALPVGAVVLLTSRRAGHVAWQKQEGDRWCEASNWECSMTSLELWAVNLPATVLFTPGEAG